MSSFFHLACFQGSPMLQHVSVSFFLYLDNIPLYEHITFCLSIHLFIDIWIFSTLGLSWITLLWTVIYNFVCEHTFSGLLDIFPGVQLLDHMEKTCLTFWGIAKLFFHRGYTILHSCWQCMRVLISLYPHQHLFFSLKKFFFIAILLGVKYLIMVLICISFITNNVEHVFMCL